MAAAESLAAIDACLLLRGGYSKRIYLWVGDRDFDVAPLPASDPVHASQCRFASV